MSHAFFTILYCCTYIVNVRNFTIEDTYTHGTLTPEVPLLARMALMGTIPNNGISYVDTDGTERYFTVNVSGYDGSLLLTESEPFTG